MIDLHNHSLHGLDDGPSSLATSLDMLMIACVNGISHVILTPHIQTGRYDNTQLSIANAFKTLKKAASENNIPIRLGFAAEVSIDPSIIPMIEEGRIPFLGSVNNKKVLLIELPHSHIPKSAFSIIQWLVDHDIRPMIAHPERNKDVIKDYDKLAPFFEMKCLMQVTAASVAGGFGHEAYKVAARMLEDGDVYALASDAHNTQFRAPKLIPGMEAAADIIGRKSALKLIIDNPMHIINAQFSSTKVDLVL